MRCWGVQEEGRGRGKGVGFYPGNPGWPVGSGVVFSCGVLLLLTTQGLATPPTGSLPTLREALFLKATYVGIRHGESVPSSEGRVCGSLACGLDPRNGLTPEGRLEIRRATEAWSTAHEPLIENALRRQRLVILSSPFSRTIESAELVADTIVEHFKSRLNTLPGTLRPQIRLEPDLRERNFGRYEGQYRSDLVYPLVWAEDARDPAYAGEGIESSMAVQERVLAVIGRLEAGRAAADGWLYLLVSHGDVLKILATGFSQLSASAHQNPRQVPPFRTGEFRFFAWRPPSLTKPP